MNKIKLIILAILSLNVVYAEEYKLNLGISPLRKTYIRENNQLEVENGSIGLSVGAEVLWGKDFKYGLGAELKNKINHKESFFNNQDGDYYSQPVYGTVSYKLPLDFYVLGRLGIVFNDGDLVTNVGKYAGLGIGKKIGNYDVSLLYEGSELKKSKDVLVFNKDVSHSGLFFDGALDEISLKVGYTFGKGNKTVIQEKIVEKIVPVEKIVTVEKIVSVEKEWFNKPVVTLEDNIPVFTDSKKIPSIKMFGNEIENVLYTYKLEKINPYQDLGTTEKTALNEYVLSKNLEDGKYKVTINVFKNEKIETTYKEFIIDSTAPKIDIKASSDKNNVKWAWNLDDVKGKVTEVRLNGIVIDSKENTYSSNLNNGNYILTVRAEDENNNKSIADNLLVLNYIEQVQAQPVVEQKVIEAFAKGIAALLVVDSYKIKITSLTKNQEQIVYEALRALEGKKGTLKIIGYTDDTGTEKINLKLSKERAHNVAEIVRRMSNNKDLVIEAIGKGETEFKYPNTSEKTRKLNRRIEFEFTEIK